MVGLVGRRALRRSRGQDLELQVLVDREEGAHPVLEELCGLEAGIDRIHWMKWL